jgi:uncharacterized protein YndB with AHSA1/START domain
MNTAPEEEQSVIVERMLSHPPEKVWRALTQPHLLEAWLTASDFSPVVGHRFKLGFDWGDVDGRVLEVEPGHALSYTWTSGELDSVVTWTLTPTPTGTLLRMEQVGFPSDRSRYYVGASAGWPRFISALELVLEGVDEGEVP